MEKKDIEAALNELLGLDIRWSALKMEDLQKLVEYFSDEKRVFDTLGKELVKDRLSSRLDSLFAKLRIAQETKKFGSSGVLSELIGKG